MSTPSGASSLASDWGREEYPDQIGPFQILGVLGRGGMGVVFDAATKDGRKVALKVIRPQGDHDQSQLLVARFLREAKILQQLNHPGVVRLIDSGDVDGTLYLAMERIEGVSLLTIRRRGPLGFDALVQLGIQLSDALQHLHAAGVVHRDIKPANILIDRHGQPVITDFGISGMNEATGITRMGDLLGSPGFMAPEVTEGIPPSELSDQFALGRLLYELGASGPAKKLPKNAPILEILTASLEIDWNRFPPSGAWPQLEAILRRMLASDPRDRFPSANAVKSALLALTTTDLLDVDTLSEHIGRLGVEPRMSWDLGSSAPEQWLQIGDPRAPIAMDPDPPPASQQQRSRAEPVIQDLPQPPVRPTSVRGSSRPTSSARAHALPKETTPIEEQSLAEWSANEWTGDSGRYDKLASELAAAGYDAAKQQPQQPPPPLPQKKPSSFAHAALDLVAPPQGKTAPDRPVPDDAVDAFSEKTALDPQPGLAPEDVAPPPPRIEDVTVPAPGPMAPKPRSGQMPILSSPPLPRVTIPTTPPPPVTRDRTPAPMLTPTTPIGRTPAPVIAPSPPARTPMPVLSVPPRLIVGSPPPPSISVSDPLPAAARGSQDTLEETQHSLEATLPMSPTSNAIAAAAAVIVAQQKASQAQQPPPLEATPLALDAESVAAKPMPLYRIEGRPDEPPPPRPSPQTQPDAQEQIAKLEKQIVRLREQLLTQSRRDLAKRDEGRSPLVSALGIVLAAGIGLLGGLFIKRAAVDAPPVVIVPALSGDLAEPAARYRGTAIPTSADIENARAFFATAMEHLAREDLPGAKALLQQCIEVADLPECHRTIGTLLAITRQPAARTHFDHYLHIAPNAPDADAIRGLLQRP